VKYLAFESSTDAVRFLLNRKDLRWYERLVVKASLLVLAGL